MFLFFYLTFWHRSFTFNSNKSPTRCNNFSVYYPEVCLQFNMFRAFPTHHQELNDCSGSLWFYLRIVVTVVQCSWSSLLITGPTTNTARLPVWVCFGWRTPPRTHSNRFQLCHDSSSFLTGAQNSHLQRVTIPEAAYIQLRRRPPEDEQGNARKM